MTKPEELESALAKAEAALANAVSNAAKVDGDRAEANPNLDTARAYCRQLRAALFKLNLSESIDWSGKWIDTPIKQLEEVSNRGATAVIVNPQLSAKTFREFVDLARGQPGRLYYSSPGNGGPQHLAMELLKQETGIDLVHVPYKGSGGAIADLIAGHVQAMIISLQTAAPYVQGGKLRMLAVMSAERSPAFADIPTTKELGLPNLEVETWYGVFAPAGTPGSIVAKLNAELNTLLRQPDVRELLAKQGMVPAGGPPDRFGDLLKLELARWSRVVAAAGIKAD